MIKKNKTLNCLGIFALQKYLLVFRNFDSPVRWTQLSVAFETKKEHSVCYDWEQDNSDRFWAGVCPVYTIQRWCSRMVVTDVWPWLMQLLQQETTASSYPSSIFYTFLLCAALVNVFKSLSFSLRILPYWLSGKVHLGTVTDSSSSPSVIFKADI